jgi:hypothetical protein
VLGYEGRYEISDVGRVLSRCRRRPKLLTPTIDRYGYLCVHLCQAGKSRSRPVHQLVCEAWHGPRPDGLVVRHLDGDPLNLEPGNLKWGTPAENSQDRSLHGRDQNASKTHCPAGHPYEGDNLVHERDGSRKCRICKLAGFRRYADEHREELNANAREYHRRLRESRTPEEHAIERAERREWEAQNREQRRQEVTAERAAMDLPPLVRNAAKTHCPQGHEYTPENTYVVPKSGTRQCRTCRAVTMRLFFERQQQRKREAAALAD